MQSTPSLHTPSLRTRCLWGAALGVGVAVLLGFLRTTEFVHALELRAVDTRTRHIADEREPDPRIVLLQIEEADVEDVRRDLGVPWPWSLEYNAHIVNVLREAGASVLVVDILHLDKGAGPDDVPDSEALPPAAREQRAVEARTAETYGAALERFGATAVAFELAVMADYDVPARRTAARERFGPGDVLADGSAAAPTGTLHRGANLPVRRVTEKARVLGFANTRADFDGVVRRADVFGRYGEKDTLVLSLPLAGAGLAAGGIRATEDGVQVGDASQRLMQGKHFLVNHHAASYRRVRPAQVLAWAIAKESEGTLPQAARDALDHTIVVFGINLAGQKDVVATPLGTMEGPAWQATVLDNLLHGDGRVRVGRVLDVVLLALLAIVAGVLGTALPTRWLPHVVPVVLGAMVWFASLALFRSGHVTDLVTPLLALMLVWGGTFALRALTEGRRNRWLEGVFGRYMSPTLVTALKRDPSLIALGGRTREISILFSDVAGFTRLSEKLHATEVVQLLNHYLTEHCAAVMQEDGVIDKFEGDAVMAFFGDPVKQPDHALRACRAALRVQADLPQLDPLLDRLGIDDFAVRIGINSGEAVVGNMGSSQRFDYTCIGDSVNLASRLEGANKAFGTHILIGAATAAAVETAMLLRPLGSVRVVGREEPVEVFELVAERSTASRELAAQVAAFVRAFEAVRGGEDATDALAGTGGPGVGAVAWLREVAEAHAGRPWDGITHLDRK